MNGNSQRSENSNGGPQRREPLEAPACVHVYVWVFMVTLSVSPILYLLAVGDDIEGRDWLGSLVVVAIIQVALWVAQRRCSSEDLTYWEGLLATAASVTTGENLISLLRAFPLLLTVVIVSMLIAVSHDETSAARHAQLRYGRLVVSVYRQHRRRR